METEQNTVEDLELDDDFDFDDENSDGESLNAEQTDDGNSGNSIAEDTIQTEGGLEQSPEGQDEPSYTIKYNGDKMQLPLSELITNAQKGMNYDKVLSERDELRPLKTKADAIDRLAKHYGMTPEQYMAEVEHQERELAVQSQIDNGIPREIAERLLTLESNESMRLQKDLELQSELEQKKQYLDFVSKYPDVKELPNEVIEQMEKGIPLSYAYGEYENKRLKLEIQTLMKNNENANKSTGSMQSEALNRDIDDFMSGFDNA